VLAEFRRRFWLPPRAHGEVIEDRTVSFLELFYDLVYVVVIGRAAHTLAEHITWRGVGEFAVVFGLIWIAWMNGTLYYELHGREDGRTRTFVFIQMLLLALLAVFTAEAAGESGAQFALVYTAYLAVVSWLWYTVRRQDTDEFMAMTSRYLSGMVGSMIVVGISAAVPDGPRMILWSLLVVGWVVGGLLLGRTTAIEHGVTVTDSMVERYGLFVIIVLGEVVIGVVNGLSESERTFRTVATGLLGLMIGFAYWWSYFDYIGRRLPVDTPPIRVRWMYAHLPVTMSIAAAGAAMVSLIEHAADTSAPTSTSWLLGGSVALGLIALTVKMTTLRDYPRLQGLYRTVMGALLVAAIVAVFVAWLAPAPWLLALLLVLTLLGVWFVAASRWIRDGPSPT
jgi:low temperature requirement protein LtrA